MSPDESSTFYQKSVPIDTLNVSITVSTGIGFYQIKELELFQQIVTVLTKLSSGLWQSLENST